VLGLYVVLDNLLPILFSGGSGGVAYGAHLGGFFGGLLIAAVINRFEPETAQLRGRSRRRDADTGVIDFQRQRQARGGVPSEALQTLRIAQTSSEAFRALREVDARDLAALPPRQIARLARWLSEAGHISSGIWMFRQALRAEPRSAGLQLGLGLMRFAEGQEATAYQHLMAAAEMDPNGEAGDIAREAIEQVNLYRRS